MATFQTISSTFNQVFKNSINPENKLSSPRTFSDSDRLLFTSDNAIIVFKEEKIETREGKTVKITKTFLEGKNRARDLLNTATNTMASPFFPSLNKFRTFLLEKKWLMLDETLVLGEAGDKNFPIEEGGRFFRLALEMDGSGERRTIDLPIDGQNVTILKSAILEAAGEEKINRMVLHYIDNDEDTEIEAVNLFIPDEEETLHLVQGLLADFLQQKKELLKTVNNVLGNLNDRHFPEEENYARWLLKNFNISLDTE
ncbi:MAG: hypothetical protein J5I94_00280 [Phaeodactylibacter sp.]|nr:hypothetical protein [Phaeodactylibacter sp.]